MVGRDSGRRGVMSLKELCLICLNSKGGKRAGRMDGGGAVCSHGNVQCLCF